ncbi:MAG: dTMP kinase [SAR324 cluster bacterium]|nr:dTMP kinase [SAR324 cluster bacterium]
MDSGKFITFEGIDGCGKTTQIKLISEWISSRGIDTVTTREPGGSAIGQQIRTILLNPANHELSEASELLLYLADRIQHLKQVILPAMNQGKLVLCDRFHDSTIAYQGYGRQLDLTGISSIVEQWVAPHMPDLSILIRISPETALERISQRQQVKPDLSQESRFDQETLAFFQRVAHGFDELSRQSPDRIAVVDGNQSVDAVFTEIKHLLETRLSKTPT